MYAILSRALVQIFCFWCKPHFGYVVPFFYILGVCFFMLEFFIPEVDPGGSVPAWVG